MAMAAGEEYDRSQVERIGRDAARKQAGDLLVGADAGGDVAGVTLGEEFNRQRHHMPEEAADHDDRELGLQPQQQRLAHAVKTARTSAVSAMPMSNGTSQLLVCWIRMWSTKILEKPGSDDRRHDQRETDRRPAARRRPSRSATRAAAAAGPAACCRTCWNAAVGSMARATPVNARSSSTMSSSPAADRRIVDVDVARRRYLRAPRND